MENLFQFSASRINSVDTSFKRYLWDKINWNNRLIAITGARGVGKTTLLLQYIKENLNDSPDAVIYVNMDDLYFSKNTLVDFQVGLSRKGENIFSLMKSINTETGLRRLKISTTIFPI